MADRIAAALAVAGVDPLREPPAHGEVLYLAVEEATPPGWKVRVCYDPTLDRLGELDHGFDGAIIRLREWNERVFLHELLHALLDRWTQDIPPRWTDKTASEEIVQQVEDGLWNLGWRWADNPSSSGQAGE